MPCTGTDTTPGSVASVRVTVDRCRPAPASALDAIPTLLSPCHRVSGNRKDDYISSVTTTQHTLLRLVPTLPAPVVDLLSSPAPAPPHFLIPLEPGDTVTDQNSPGWPRANDLYGRNTLRNGTDGGQAPQIADDGLGI